MTDPLELFAKLTCCLEDLHGLAVEGQAADQPTEMLLILAEHSCNGVQLCGEIVAQIKISLGAA